MFGFLNIYKPRGMSSYDVIRNLKKLLPRDTHIGHAGTLDPLAEGVLVVCLGNATRLAETVQEYPKEYVTRIRLGESSTTDDAEGDKTPLPPPQPPTRADVDRAVLPFVGDIQQVPPAHSAVKVDGQRAYSLARKGAPPRLAAKNVKVYAIDVLTYEYPDLLLLRIRCGTGTYIRSLARDIGAALHTAGYCLELARTVIGPFTVATALKADALPKDLAPHLLPAVMAFPVDRRIAVTPRQIADLAHGRAIMAQGAPENVDLAAVDESGVVVGVLRCQKGMARPVKVFAAP